MPSLLYSVTHHQRHPFARIGCRYPYINKLLTKCQQLSTDYSFFLDPLSSSSTFNTTIATRCLTANLVAIRL